MVNSDRDNLDIVESLDHALKGLTPYEEKMIKMRYGWGPHGEIYSVKEIAAHFARSESFVYKRLSRARGKLNSILTMLATSHRSAQEFQKIAQILKDAKRKGATAEEISTSIKTQLPELSSLGDVLPKTRAELYAFLALILTAISILITLFNSKDDSLVITNQTSNVINQVMHNERAMRKPYKSKQRYNHKRNIRKMKKPYP